MVSTVYKTTTTTNEGGKDKTTTTTSPDNPATSTQRPPSAPSGNTTRVSPFPFNTGNISGPANYTNVYTSPKNYASAYAGIPVNRSDLQSQELNRQQQAQNLSDAAKTSSGGLLRNEWGLSRSEYMKRHANDVPERPPAITTYTKVETNEKGEKMFTQMMPGFSPPTEKPLFPVKGIDTTSMDLSKTAPIGNLSALTPIQEHQKAAFEASRPTREGGQAITDFGSGFVVGTVFSGFNPAIGLGVGLANLAVAPASRYVGKEATSAAFNVDYSAHGLPNIINYPDISGGSHSIPTANVIGGVAEFGTSVALFGGLSKVGGSALGGAISKGKMSESKGFALTERVGVVDAQTGKMTADVWTTGENRVDIPIMRQSKTTIFATKTSEPLRMTATPSGPATSESILTGRLRLQDVRGSKLTNPREITITEVGGSKEILRETNIEIPEVGKQETSLSKVSSAGTIETTKPIGGGIFDFFKTEAKRGSLATKSEISVNSGFQEQITTKIPGKTIDLAFGEGKFTKPGQETNYLFTDYMGRTNVKPEASPVFKVVNKPPTSFRGFVEESKQGEVMQISTPKPTTLKFTPSSSTEGITNAVSKSMSKELGASAEKSIYQTGTKSGVGLDLVSPTLTAQASSSKSIYASSPVQTVAMPKNSVEYRSTLISGGLFENKVSSKSGQKQFESIQTVGGQQDTWTKTEYISKTEQGYYPYAGNVPAPPYNGGGMIPPIPLLGGGGLGGGGIGGDYWRKPIRTKRFKRPIRDAASYLGLNILGRGKRK